jgi:hypothetical protein
MRKSRRPLPRCVSRPGSDVQSKRAPSDAPSSPGENAMHEETGSPIADDGSDARARIGRVVDAMYAMISGPAGPRDWARQRDIFHPHARQMRTGEDVRSGPWIKIMSLDEYRANVTPIFAATPFYEVEMQRRIDVLGNMAHVWSVYEARRSPDDAIPERRGVNSIQLFQESPGAWRIVSMIWDNERAGVEVAPF